MILILAVTLIIVGWLILTDDPKDPYAWFGALTLGTIGAFITGLCLTVIGNLFFADEYQVYKTKHEFEIIAAADGSLTEGNFFIFGGQIDQTPMYFFYRKNANGAITQDHVPVKHSVIYEDQENAGYVKVLEDDLNFEPFFIVTPQGNDKYEIHVPKNSVTRSFNFDLEQ